MRPLLLPLFLVVLATVASAQTPRTISYQGLLADNEGAPLPNGSHQFTVRLYENATGGTPIWSETHTVAIIDGIFNMTLGSVTPIPPSLLFDRQYYLGVSVEGAAELVPRTALTSAPYSLRAAVAESVAPNATGVVTSVNGLAGAVVLQGGGSTTVTQSGGRILISSSGGSSSGIAGVQSTDGSIGISDPNGPVANLTLADGAVTTSKLGAGAVTLDKLNTTGASPGQVLTFNGSTLDYATPSSFTLPYAMTMSSPTPLFRLTNPGIGTAVWGEASGAAGGAGHFGITNAANTADALLVSTIGSGNALNVNGKVQQTGGSVLFAGGTGGTPASGAGARLMWIPVKRAFRAGDVNGTQWDDASIGSYSVAMGANTIASGAYATAFGGGATASGNSSTASGFAVTASGHNSFATGYYTTASGFNAVATGSATQAIGEASAAFGANTESRGLASMTMGRGTVATGARAMAIGDSTTASGDNALAVGALSTATGDHSMAVGYSSDATSNSAFAAGRRATASGLNSIALGGSVTASGAGTIAIGYNVTAAHSGSVIFGDGSGTTPMSTTSSNQFAVRSANIWFGSTNTVQSVLGRYINTSTGAYLTTGGAWTNSSDRNRKTELQTIDTRRVLESVASMPITSWRYIDESRGVRHIGPMAQDFHAAFAVGHDSTSISTVDADGVSLAAIQALYELAKEQREEIAALKKRIEELERR